MNRFVTAIFLIYVTTCHAIPIEVTEERRCSECRIEFCPKSADDCTHGLVNDLCGCCPEGVCQLIEREKCLSTNGPNVTDANGNKYGSCGPDADCVLRTDLKINVSF